MPSLEEIDQDIQDVIIGIIAMQGATGCAADNIFNELSASIIAKYRAALGKQHLNDDEIFKIVLGKMITGGKIKASSPGGLVRFVVCSGRTLSM